nr:amidase [Carbonactinospora thermoautotrophica]
MPIGATSVPLKSTGWQTWGHTDRGPTVNPWRPDRVPGGSSAGSAAAVAAGIVPLATASDGAGSTRIPAAWCGVVGVKPTTGRLPGDAAGLAVPGPVARTVRDAARYLEVILGTALTTAARTDQATQDRAYTAAWSATLGYGDTDPDVAAVAHAAAQTLTAAGVIAWRPVPVRLLDLEPAWRALRDPAGDRDAAAALRAENSRRLADVFADVDLLVTPTTPNRPHGHAGPGARMSVALTWAFNVSGHPAISVPAGFTADGCPVGLQLVARHHAEADLIHVAAAFEHLAPWPAPTGQLPRRPSTPRRPDGDGHEQLQARPAVSAQGRAGRRADPGPAACTQGFGLAAVAYALTSKPVGLYPSRYLADCEPSEEFTRGVCRPHPSGGSAVLVQVVSGRWAATLSP